VKGVTVIEHPLVQHGLARLRDGNTDLGEFRRVVGQLGVLLVYEATHSLPVKPVTVKTPLATARGERLRGDVVLVPVLRAGLGMLHAVTEFIPDARVGFIGLARDEETLEARRYHCSLAGELDGSDVLLLDPMLATGGSAVAALEIIRARRPRSIRMVNLLAAPEGVRRVRRAHPDVPIVVASIDTRLNGKGYIVPGLGDAGRRLFGV
jgi:uracil phosphoribosyltransferase